MQRIGIYAGTFDPVHDGHISFARAAMDEAALDEVRFLPERAPRHKPNVSAYLERLRLLDQTTARYDSLRTLELPETILSVHDTLPHLQQRFRESELVLLVGVDVVRHMHTWPGIDRLVASCGFVIGARDGYDRGRTIDELRRLGISRYSIIRTKNSHLSSTLLRNKMSK